MIEIVPKKPTRRQQLWVCVIGLLFLADFIVCGYEPSYARLKALGEARAEQHRIIATAAAQSRELPSLQQRLTNAKEIVEHYEAYVPAEASLGTFLQRIAFMMTTHRLADQVVMPGKETEADGVRCISIHMTCTGTLKDVFGFFRDFQTMDRLVRIDRVALVNDSGFTGRIKLETEAVIFYRPSEGSGASDRSSQNGAVNDA